MSRGLVSLLSCLLSLPSVPAQAVDIVPFVGFRFGGNVDATPTGATIPESLTINAALSYGGMLDIPISKERSVELYYSRQPTTLSGGGTLTEPLRDVTVSVLQIGLVDSYQTDDERFRWLLEGMFGATQLNATGGSATRASIGLGGGFLWMASPHVGLRGDIRTFITFTGGGGGSIVCGGGCTVSLATTAIAQGEATLGLVARF